MKRGKRRMFSRERETKALSAVKTFSGEERMYVAKVVNATCNVGVENTFFAISGEQEHTNRPFITSRSW